MDLSKMSQSGLPVVSTSYSSNASTSLAGSPIRQTGNPVTFPTAFAMMDYAHPMAGIGAANPFRAQQQAAQQQYLAAHQAAEAMAAQARYRAAFFPTSQMVVPPNMALPFPSFAYPGHGYPPQFAPGYPRNFFGRFVQREAELPKPQHSYIGLIAMAILSSPEKKMILNDIYQWIQDHYPYFKNRPPGWKNSIRHNLSLNACFIKCGRSATGKGHFWAIHPANVKDFEHGDFRRRKAQQKVHRMMGMAVGEDEDIEASPSPSLSDEKNQAVIYDELESPMASTSPKSVSSVVTGSNEVPSKTTVPSKPDSVVVTQRKRTCFDMDSLLAPDTKEKSPKRFGGDHPPNIPTVQARKGDVVASPLEQYLTAPKTTFEMQTSQQSPVMSGSLKVGAESHLEALSSDSTKEQWNQSFARIMARSYSAKFNNSP